MSARTIRSRKLYHWPRIWSGDVGAAWQNRTTRGESYFLNRSRHSDPADQPVWRVVYSQLNSQQMNSPAWVPLCDAFLLACLITPRIAAQSSNDVERYAEQGQRALAQENYSAAEQAFEKLRALQPGVAEVHANLGLIYFEERKYEQAVASLRQALKLKPSLQRSDTLLALSLSELSRYREALPGLEKGFRAAKDADTKRLCGLQLLRAYEGLQRNDQAMQVALELTRGYPNDPEVLYHAGKSMEALPTSRWKLVKVAPDSVWRHQAAAEADESQDS